MSAEIPDGAVLIARAILNSSLWSMRPEDRVVAITCIAIANHRGRSWWNGKDEIQIERGQFVRSWEKLTKECGLPLQVVRTSVQHLENTRFLTRLPTGRFSIYTIPKYQHYQDLTKYSDSVMSKANKTSNKQLTSNQQAANNKQVLGEFKNEKKGGRRHSGDLRKAARGSPPVSVGRGATGPGPSREEVVRLYCERHPGVMGEEKALKQVEIFESRGLSLDSMVVMLKKEPEGRRPIWEILEAAPRNGNGRHEGDPAKKPEDRNAERTRAQAREGRRAAVADKLRECESSELSAWSKAALEEAKAKKLSGAYLDRYVQSQVFLQCAKKFGIEDI